MESHSLNAAAPSAMHFQHFHHLFVLDPCQSLVCQHGTAGRSSAYLIRVPAERLHGDSWDHTRPMRLRRARSLKHLTLVRSALRACRLCMFVLRAFDQCARPILCPVFPVPGHSCTRMDSDALGFVRLSVMPLVFLLAPCVHVARSCVFVTCILAPSCARSLLPCDRL